MITVQGVVYNEVIDRTAFLYTFEKSGYKQSTSATMPGHLSEAEIIQALQPEYEAWIERNQIP